mmetsp:Transcript_121276/g.210829  ORF Transcript_121276/g.210829 Transcript_121276/m.210829 type:complete len:95 (+) Transcript_121276:811-1095(+)
MGGEEEEEEREREKERERERERDEGSERAGRRNPWWWWTVDSTSTESGIGSPFVPLRSPALDLGRICHVAFKLAVGAKSANQQLCKWQLSTANS